MKTFFKYTAMIRSVFCITMLFSFSTDVGSVKVSAAPNLNIDNTVFRVWQIF